MEQKPNSTTELQHNARLSFSRSYLYGQGHVHDIDLAYLAELPGKTHNEVTDDLVNKGWSKGMDIYGNFEYWEGCK